MILIVFKWKLQTFLFEQQVSFTNWPEIPKKKKKRNNSPQNIFSLDGKQCFQLTLVTGFLQSGRKRGEKKHVHKPCGSSLLKIFLHFPVLPFSWGIHYSSESSKLFHENLTAKVFFIAMKITIALFLFYLEWIELVFYSLFNWNSILFIWFGNSVALTCLIKRSLRG